MFLLHETKAYHYTLNRFVQCPGGEVELRTEAKYLIHNARPHPDLPDPPANQSEPNQPCQPDDQRALPSVRIAPGVRTPLLAAVTKAEWPILRGGPTYSRDSTLITDYERGKEGEEQESLHEDRDGDGKRSNVRLHHLRETISHSRTQGDSRQLMPWQLSLSLLPSWTRALLRRSHSP